VYLVLALVVNIVMVVVAILLAFFLRRRLLQSNEKLAKDEVDADAIARPGEEADMRFRFLI
jgi:hypothetical protein